MTNTSLLEEIIALFDSAQDKICPILGTDSLSSPATFVRVVSGGNAEGKLKLTFELTYRYRDTSPRDSLEALRYLQYLCSAAESTGKTEVVSIEGGGTSDGSVGVCRARLKYYPEKTKIRFLTDSSDLSALVKTLVISDCSEVLTKKYYCDSTFTRVRNDGGCKVKLECTSLCGAEIMYRYGNEAGEASFSVGGLVASGRFVLGKLSAGDTVSCELYSTGPVEYGIDF